MIHSNDDDHETIDSHFTFSCEGVYFIVAIIMSVSIKLYVIDKKGEFGHLTLDPLSLVDLAVDNVDQSTFSLGETV